jgi:hypothetical protein
VAAAADLGAMPTLSPGAEVGGSLGYGVLRVSALGTILIAPAHQVEAGKGAELTLTLGALLGCGRWVVGPVSPLLCVGVEVGELSGTGTGVRRPRSGGSLWWGPRADVGILLPIAGSFSLLARSGLIFPQIRRDFVVDETVVVNRPAALTGRMTLGLELGLE